jgi:HAD superfamily hydrolase (TIGR01509 family)
MVKAIIFDYYGVIQPDALASTYSHFGGDPGTDAQFIADTIYAANMGHIPGSRWVFAKRLGVSVDEWMHELKARAKRDPDLLAYILELRQSYKTGLLSNVGRGGLQVLWGEDELETYFDAAIASGDVGMAKPDLRIFRLMAERLGVDPSECVLTDDQPAYCDRARSIGMQAIHYRHFKQFKHELQALLKAEHPPHAT